MRVIFTFFLVVLSQSLYAQDVPTPEKNKRPYFLINGELAKAEKVKADLDFKVKAMGYGGSEAYLTAYENKSKVRFSSKNIPKIIIKLEGDEDVEDYITILRQTSKKRKKDRRRFKQSSRTLMGKSRRTDDAQVSFELEKISANTYQIIFDNPLSPDEYAVVPVTESSEKSILSVGRKQTIFCFGID